MLATYFVDYKGINKKIPWFLLLKIYEKSLGESFLKHKNKRDLCIFFVPYHVAPYPWNEVHILTRSDKFQERKDKFQFWWLRQKMRDLDNFSQFSLISNTFVM